MNASISRHCFVIILWCLFLCEAGHAASYDAGVKVVDGKWSKPIKESSGHSFQCDENWMMSGRSHFGDENKTTFYRCEKIKIGMFDIFTVDEVKSKPIKENNTRYTCPEGYVMIGREHEGDEKGLTTYTCAKPYGKLVNHPVNVSLNGEITSTPESESYSYYKCPNGSVMTGRYHSGDENGLTKYQCSYLKLELTDLKFLSSDYWVDIDHSSIELVNVGHRVATDVNFVIPEAIKEYLEIVCPSKSTLNPGERCYLFNKCPYDLNDIPDGEYPIVVKSSNTITPAIITLHVNSAPELVFGDIFNSLRRIQKISNYIINGSGVQIPQVVFANTGVKPANNVTIEIPEPVRQYVEILGCDLEKLEDDYCRLFFNFPPDDRSLVSDYNLLLTSPDVAEPTSLKLTYTLAEHLSFVDDYDRTIDQVNMQSGGRVFLKIANQGGAPAVLKDIQFSEPAIKASSMTTCLNGLTLLPADFCYLYLDFYNARLPKPGGTVTVFYGNKKSTVLSLTNP